MTDYQRREARHAMLASRTPPPCTCDRSEGTHHPNGAWSGPIGGHTWRCNWREWAMQGFC